MVNDVIVVMDKFDPKFKEWAYVHSSRTLLFVYRSDEGYWGVQTTNDPEQEFRATNSRKLFPIEWRGLRGSELSEVCFLETAEFCDPTGYIAGFGDREDAIDAAVRVASLYINSSDK